jgi:hypothetical protein
MRFEKHTYVIYYRDIYEDIRTDTSRIKFDFGLEKASPRLWIALGEAHSKCEHMAGCP